MCLAVPGRVVETDESSGLLMAEVAYGPVRNRVCLEYVPEAREGDFVMVHAGFAISIVDPDEAEKSLAAWRDYVEAALAAGIDVGDRDLLMRALGRNDDGRSD